MNFIPKKNILTLSYTGIAFLFFFIFWKLLIYKLGSTDGSATVDLLNCDDFEHLSVFSILGKGWTKIVYKGSWRNVPLAVKTVNSHGQEMNSCKETYSQCMVSLQQNLAKELSTLHHLDHPNIIKLYGSCLDSTSNDSAGGALLVELGQPLTSFSLVQKDFESRIKLAQDLCSLLVYLGNFPTGAILVPDFRLQQFVVVEGHLKLADGDDLQFGDRNCLQDSYCVVSHVKGKDVTVGCKGGKCEGLNDALNVWRACQSILPYLLAFGTPERFSNAAKQILECQKGLSWSSRELEAAVQRMADQFHASARIEDGHGS